MGGTGFIVDDEWHIVTADHVVNPNLMKAEIEQIEKGKGRTLVTGSIHVEQIIAAALSPIVDGAKNPLFYGSPMVFEARVLKQDERRDIAILSAPTIKPVKNQYGAFVPAMTFIHGKAARPTIAELQVQKPRAGDSISVSGFPAFLATNGQTFQFPELITDSGTISNATHVSA